MTWTKNKPTKDGFYWLRRPGLADTIVKVYDVSAGLIEFGAMVSRTGSDNDVSLCNAPASVLWSGPILPPEKAPPVVIPAESLPLKRKQT